MEDLKDLVYIGLCQSKSCKHTAWKYASMLMDSLCIISKNTIVYSNNLGRGREKYGTTKSIEEVVMFASIKVKENPGLEEIVNKYIKYKIKMESRVKINWRFLYEGKH